MEKHTFSKEERLSSRKLIEQVAKEGKSFLVHPFKVIALETTFTTAFPAQVMMTAPKKRFPRAVDRNRIKRLMREAYRLSKARLYERLAGRTQQVAWLFIYQGKGLTTWEVTEQKISRSLDRWMKEHG